MSSLKLEPVSSGTKTSLIIALIIIICAVIGAAGAKAQLGIETPGLIPLAACEANVSADSLKVCNNVYMGDFVVAASLNEARLMFTYAVVGAVIGLVTSMAVVRQKVS